MLKVINTSTGYTKKQVLFDISFEILPCEIVLLVGSNGSGKSTLLKTIYNLLPQWDNGQVFFDGSIITDQATTSLLKRGLLYIPQKFNLFEALTVKENLEIAGLTLDQGTFKMQMEKVVSDFEFLKPLLNRYPMNLSGGERKLLTLSMACLHNPKMILVDEPYTGLSPHNISIVTDKLKELNTKHGITMLIAEHRVRECSQIADKIIGLKLGKFFNEITINNKFNINDLNAVFF